MKPMKKISAIIITMMILGTGIAFAKTEEIKIKTSTECDMCKARVQKALSFEKGIKDIDVNYEKKEITVVYNPKKTTPEKIRTAISKAGYDADDVKADPKAYEKLPNC